MKTLRNVNTRSWVRLGAAGITVAILEALGEGVSLYVGSEAPAATDGGFTLPSGETFVVPNVTELGGRLYVRAAFPGRSIRYAVNGDPEVSTDLLTAADWPEQPQAYPVNILPQDPAEFTTDAGWVKAAGADGITFNTTTGEAEFRTTTAVSLARLPLPAPTVVGRSYAFLSAITAITSGSMQMGASVPGSQTATGTGMNGSRHFARRLQATAAYANAHLHAAADSSFNVDFLRMYDLTELLQKKWRIVFVYSQSNWVGTEDAADRLQNDRPEPRAVVIPSQQNNIRGSELDANGVGIPMPLVDPVVHLTLSNGGPAGAFAREFCDGLRNDEVLVYVATGYGGGGRMAEDGVWNRQNNGVAWANMLRQVDGALAQAPTGSTVAGMLFCQGEADLSANTGDTHTSLIRADFEFLRTRYGNFPIVVNEIGWDFSVGRNGLENMLASQAKLDSDSGDALSLPLCRYLPRPTGATFVSDNLHYDQVTQRARGKLAAENLMAMLYGRPRP